MAKEYSDLDILNHLQQIDADCNVKKSNHIGAFALLAWHELAAGRAPTVLRLIEEYKKANKE